MDVKRCPRCDTVRDLTDFYRHRSRPDGRAAWCRWCHCDAKAEWRAANLERARAYDRARKRAAA